MPTHPFGSPVRYVLNTHIKFTCTSYRLPTHLTPPPGPSWKNSSDLPMSPASSTQDVSPKYSGTPHSDVLSSSFHDLNPANYAPSHESRRRNAEQRAATLRADTLIGEVEPNRVFCSLCQKWVQLRQDSSYCAYPWLQHRGKCLARQ